MGQLQGQAYFLFSASWGTLFLRPSCSTNGSIGQLQSGAWFVSFVMGQKSLLCPSWLSSWVCGSATNWGLFCFLMSWDTVLLHSSWLSSWVCGSTTSSFSYCAPEQWNSLPSDFPHSQSSCAFKTSYKLTTTSDFKFSCTPTTPSKNTPQTLDISLFLCSTLRQCESVG